MLEATNTALAEALSAPARRIRAQILVDWDGDGNYASTYSDLSDALADVNLDRSSRGNLPTEVRVVSGHEISSLKARLEGEVAGVPVARLFSTWRDDSPFVGKDLVSSRVKYNLIVSTASGDVTLPRFRGVVRGIDVESKARRVDIEFLDFAYTLYAPITFTIYGTDLNDLFTYGVAYRVNAQNLIDNILRLNGWYGSPPPPPDCFFSNTGHGGWDAEIGVPAGEQSPNEYPEPDETLHVAGPFPPLMGVKESALGGLADSSVDLQTNSRGVGFRCWLRLGTGVYAGTQEYDLAYLKPWDPKDSTAELALTASADGIIRAKIRDTAGVYQTISRTLGAGDQWRYVAAYWFRDSAGQWVIHLRTEGGTTTSAALTVSLSGLSVRYLASPQIPSSLPISDAAWWRDNTGTPTWHGEVWNSPETDIQVSLNELTYIPRTEKEQSLSLLREIAEAEFARFGFDETGVFRYRVANASEATTPDLEVTSEKSLVDLSSSRRLDSVRNDISIEVLEKYYNYYQKPRRCFEARDVLEFKTPPGTWIYTVPLAEGAKPIGTYYNVPYYANADWNDTVDNGFHVVRSDDTTLVPSGVTVDFWWASSNYGELHIVNNSGTTVQFQTYGDTGTPALRVYGDRLENRGPWVARKEDATSVQKFGRRALAYTRGDWRSHLDSHSGVIDAILVQTKNPTTQLEDVEIVGDPRIQIGDLHDVRDPRGLGSVSGLVESFRSKWSRRGGLRDTVTYRVIPPRFTLDSPKLGVLDSATPLA